MLQPFGSYVPSPRLQPLRVVPMQISDLHQCPWLVDTVANRIWAHWGEEERTIGTVRSRISEAIVGRAFPFVLVALDQSAFLGTVSVVESNSAPRRDLSPWLSSLWVDANHRRVGVGSALVNEAIKQAANRGRSPLYLTATGGGSQFYRRRGWKDVPSPLTDGSVMEYTWPDSIEPKWRSSLG